jgi:hypothetical protein
MACKLCIVTPCFEDEDSLGLLLRQFELVALSSEFDLDIHSVIVNDSPWSPISLSGLAGQLRIDQCGGASKSINLVTLRKNLGHQKAILIGLSKAYEMFADSCVYLLMDCDGEDRPSDFIHLYRTLQRRQSMAVVASRQKRREKLWFRAGYRFYKMLFRMLTGREIDFGNFMLLSPAAVAPMIYASDSQSHLAASLIKSRIPFSRLSLDRGARFHGESRMGGKISLIGFGIQAISIFSENVITRMLVVGSIALTAALLASVFVVLNTFIKIVPPVPGWSSLLLLLVLGICFLSILQLIGFVFIIGSSRLQYALSGPELAERMVARVDSVILS